MARAAWTALALVAAAGGCPPESVYSERANYALQGTRLYTGEVLGAWTGEPVLAGSRTCPAVVCPGCKDENVVTGPANVGRCLGDWSSTSLVVRDRCLDFIAPGIATWALGGGTCPIDGRVMPLPADQFLFTVVGADEVEARAFVAPERLALWAASQDSFITTGAPLPADLGLSRDVLTVVAETTMPLDIELVRRVDGRSVAYDGAVRVAADPRGTDVRLEPKVPGSAARLHVVEEGARATLMVDTLDGPLRAGTLRAVGEDQVAVLEVTVIWMTSEEERAPVVPVGAVALVWLADGTRADAAPVRWSIVDGELELGDPVAGIDFLFGAPAPHHVAPSPWLLLRSTEAQRNAPGRRTATLRATLGAHNVDVPLTWGSDLEPPAAPPPPAAPSSCDCGQATPGAPAAALLFALLSWLISRARHQERGAGGRRRAAPAGQHLRPNPPPPA